MPPQLSVRQLTQVQVILERQLELFWRVIVVESILGEDQNGRDKVEG